MKPGIRHEEKALARIVCCILKKWSLLHGNRTVIPVLVSSRHLIKRKKNLKDGVAKLQNDGTLAFGGVRGECVHQHLAESYNLGGGEAENMRCSSLHQTAQHKFVIPPDLYKKSILKKALMVLWLY